MEGPQFALPRTKTPETAPARRSAPGQDRAARQDVRVREEGELEHRQGAGLRRLEGERGVRDGPGARPG